MPITFEDEAPSAAPSGGSIQWDESPTAPVQRTSTPSAPKTLRENITERAAPGAVAGYFTPEAAAALGRGLSYVPYPPARAAGAALTAAAPLMGVGARLGGALAGGLSGGVGGAVETGARRVGLSPEASSALGTSAEVLTGVPTPMAMVRRAARTTEAAPATGEQLRRAVTETGEEAATAARTSAEQLRGQQLRREMATRRLGAAPERQPETPEAIQSRAATEANLPAPVTQEQIAAGQDVDAQLRRLGRTGLLNAEKTQETIGGRAFAEYKDVARRLQDERPFADSEQGRLLRDQLEQVVRGGEGDLRTATEQEVRLAREIRDELFGRPATARPADPSALDPDLAASQLPMAARIRTQQQRNAARAAEATERRPVDFNVVDTKLRELRQLEASKDISGYTGVQRQSYGSMADRIEEALRNWVGPETYPRAAYAAASQQRNLFQGRLGQALTEREALPYQTGETPPGMFVTPETRLRGVVFESRDSVRFAKELMGPEAVDRLGTQHASDQLRGKTAEQVSDWLRDPKNSFVDGIPGLRGNINRYAERLAADEARSAGMQRLQEQLRTGQTTSRQEAQRNVERLEKAQNTLSQAATRFENTPLEKMADVWASAVRPQFEQTGLFRPGELDSLERSIQRASRAASQEEAKNTIQRAISTFVQDKARSLLRGMFR